LLSLLLIFSIPALSLTPPASFFSAAARSAARGKRQGSGETVSTRMSA
jgi:hypothetical protein